MEALHPTGLPVVEVKFPPEKFQEYVLPPVPVKLIVAPTQTVPLAPLIPGVGTTLTDTVVLVLLIQVPLFTVRLIV